MGLTIFHKIFPTFNLNMENMLSVPQNTVMDLNNVMWVGLSHLKVKKTFNYNYYCIYDCEKCDNARCPKQPSKVTYHFIHPIDGLTTLRAPHRMNQVKTDGCFGHGFGWCNFYISTSTMKFGMTIFVVQNFQSVETIHDPMPWWMWLH